MIDLQHVRERFPRTFIQLLDEHRHSFLVILAQVDVQKSVNYMLGMSLILIGTNTTCNHPIYITQKLYLSSNSISPGGSLRTSRWLKHNLAAWGRASKSSVLFFWFSSRYFGRLMATDLEKYYHLEKIEPSSKRSLGCSRFQWIGRQLDVGRSLCIFLIKNCTRG